jgi:hypothetical protein
VDAFEAGAPQEQQSCLPFVLVVDRDTERYRDCRWAQGEQEAPAEGAAERPMTALVVRAGGVPEVAVMAVADTDMDGAQSPVVNLQSSYCLPVCQSGFDSISAPTGVLDHLDYKKRPA